MKDTNVTNIFYDIFDTVVSRTVQPEYVKKMWSNNIVKIFNLDVTSCQLYQTRFDVEVELGEEAKANGHDCEIKYNDIIKRIFEKLSLDIDYDLFLEKCINEEIIIESHVLFVNQDILKGIKEYKKNKCKIYCVSDMYLTKKMITTIFKNLEIDSYFDDIFVSSEFLINKRSGKLYDLVLDKLKLKPSECIMIGDNKDKDCDVPISKGMNAKFIDRTKQYQKYEEFIAKNTPEQVEERLIELSKIDNENFNNIIFSLYNFIDKLYFKLKEYNYDEVFFLAREGEYLKKLFDYYVKNICNDNIKSHYLYVSRKSTYLPSLTPLKEEDFSFLLDQYSYVTVREFLSSLNLSKEDIHLIEEDLKDLFSFDNKIGWFKDSMELKILKRSEVFERLYEKARKEQNQLFKKYIKQHSNSKRIMIVDVGWNGSIQDNIQNILGDDYQVSGCYFGLCLRNMKYAGKKYGLIFSNYPYENKQYRLYFENRTIYEIICGASHGSANKYSLKKDGQVEVLLFSKKEEQEIYKNVVKPAQDKMFEKFKLITETLCNKYYDNKNVDKIFNKIQFDMLYNPSKEQLDFFDKIYHYENFGVFEFTTFNNKSKVGLKKHIREDVKFLLKYGTYFDDAFWPVLKLHNNNMKIPYLLYKNRRKRRYKKSDLF